MNKDQDKNLSIPEELRKNAEKALRQVNESLAPQLDALESVGKSVSRIFNGVTPMAQTHFDAMNQMAKNLEPVIREFEKNQEWIKRIYESSTISSVEAMNPIIKDIEKSLEESRKLYEGYKSNKTIMIPVTPRERPTGHDKEILAELKILREFFIKNSHPETGESQTQPLSWFNSRTCAITFNGERYLPRQQAHAKLLRYLFANHQEKKNNGEILKEGQRMTEANLAGILDLTIQEFREIKKQVDRKFRENNFPLKIDKNVDGILLIHTV